jgi:gas vesicle protein
MTFYKIGFILFIHLNFKNMSSTKAVIIGVLAGAAVGALAGIFFAPYKGSVMRRKVVRKGEDYAEALKEKFDDFVDTLTDKFDSAKNGISHISEKQKARAQKLKKNVRSVMN